MKISVVIPLYNKKHTILRAINSILSQSIQVDEIVVVNDGSTDGSDEIVKALECKNIRLINKNNGGVSSARNKGIENVKNEWIAFLDADDEWRDDYIQSIVILKEKYPECMVLSTAYIIKDGDVEIKPLVSFEQTMGKITNYFKVASSGSPPLCASAVTINRKALLNVGGFSEKIKIGEDLLVWAKLAFRYEIAFYNVPKAIYHFPINDSNFLPRRPDANDLVYKELIGMYHCEKRKEIKKHIKLYIGSWCKIRLHLYSLYSMRPEALTEYYKMVKARPLNIKGLILLILAFSPKYFHDLVFKSVANKMR